MVVEERLGQPDRVEVDVLVLARDAVDRGARARRVGEVHVGGVTMAPVGTWLVDTTAIVLSGRAWSRFCGDVATSTSKPR